MPVSPFKVSVGTVVVACVARIFVAAHAEPPEGLPSALPYPKETPFLDENNAAMAKMMAGMDVKPTGDVDADFAAMMIPHHQGAIDMAVAELRYGKNEQLRRIAQEIIVDQQQEIAAMNLALGKPLLPSSAAPTQVSTNSAAITKGAADDHPPPHGEMTMSPMNHLHNMK